MVISHPPVMRRQLLSKHFLIATMPEPALDDLVKFSTVARFEPHRDIFNKGDPGDCLYGILSGRVRIYSTSPEGSEIVLNVLETGELFGEIALLDGNPRTASAAAMEHVDLLRIHRDHFLPYLKANPDLTLRILSLLCQRLRWTSSIIEDSAFLAVPARLAKRLLVLAEHYRRPKEPDITIPMSQHDLGNMVGVGRETINKQLALWRSAGIVDTGRGAIVIRNREALHALIGCAQPTFLKEDRCIEVLDRRKSFAPRPDDDSLPLPEGIEAQTRKVMDNLKRALAGAGAEHVVCVHIFLTDFERDYAAFNRLYTEYFGTDRLPARTTVGVTHLARGGIVEVDLIARRS